MMSRKVGRVTSLNYLSDSVWEAEVDIDGSIEKALGYRELVGDADEGQEVLLNTTAVELGLGTGGYHFVIAVLPVRPVSVAGDGHIMKLRYTPMQLKVLSVEEEASPYHERLVSFCSLQGMPVLVGTLHSMLGPLVVVLNRLNPRLRIAYIMTDGAALPLAFSRSVAELKERGWLSAAITAGHAFGGDLEAVNIYSALAAARNVIEADVAIVLMGPGVVGTGTALGTTALEQASILDGAAALGGKPIAVSRVSFADTRERHRGISHHTLTVLGRLTYARCHVPLPYLAKEQQEVLEGQLKEHHIREKHDVKLYQADEALTWLRDTDLTFRTMGKGLDETPEFFAAVVSAALAARP